MKRCKTPATRCNVNVHHASVPRPRKLRGLGALVLVTVLGIGACDSIPTSPPRFQTRLLVPGENTTLAVNKLLPTNVTVEGTAFRLTVPATPVPGKTLTAMCAACAGAPPGVPLPKPAFTDSVTTSINLPADVTSATLTSGSVSITLNHNFGFDVIQPAGAPGGSLVVTIRDATRVLGTTTYTGAFPSGPPLTLNIPFTAGSIAGPLSATARVTSPAATVAMNSTGTFGGTATPGPLLVSEARVALVNRQVASDPVSIDLTDIDETLSNHVISGAFVLVMTNPFTTTGNLSLVVTGAAMPISKTISIATGTTTQRIAFTQQELQAMFGRNITITISGPINATGGSLLVRPGQVVSVSTNLDLVFEVGT